MSDLIIIVVVLVIVAGIIYGVKRMNRYVRAQMQLFDEERSRFAREYGLKENPDHSMEGVVDGVEIKMETVHIPYPAYRHGEHNTKKTGRMETFRVQVPYADHQWFICEQKPREYLDDQKEPISWVDYYKDKFSIPAGWPVVPREHEKFSESYRIWAEGGHFPDFPRQEEVLRWIWARDTFFVIAQNGTLTVWIPMIEIEGDAKKTFVTLEKALQNVSSLCRPEA